MHSSKLKARVIALTLLLLTGLVSVGCGSKQKTGWVNTNSLPGQTFSRHTQREAKQTNHAIVYLGSDSDSRQSANFGPKDVSFDFTTLK